MRDLLLHIGMPKTGTTAVQHVLSHNVDALERAGVVYRGWGGADRSHNFLARWVHDGRDEDVDRVVRQLDGSADATAVISCGPLFCLTANQAKRRMDRELLARLDEREERAVNRLARLTREHFERVGILVYLRRQDLALESAYNQSVKNRSWHGGDIHEFREYYGPTLRYDRVLDRWARAFGDEALDVRVYERSVLVGGDVVTDFCSALEVDPGSLPAGWDRDQRAANLRLPRDVFEYKRGLNRVPMSKLEARQAKWALRQVAQDIGLDPDRWSEILEPAERQAVIAEHARENAEVARRFAAGPGDRLFSEMPDAGTEQADPYPGLSAETGLEIHFRFRRIWNSPGYRHQRLWARLRSLIAGLLRPPRAATRRIRAAIRT